MLDLDYFASNMTNCCLINLDDMLQNGTMIGDVLIEKPHKFSTACNIAMQIVAQVGSSQWGGQTFTLSHLAPFVDESRKYFRKQLTEELGFLISKEKLDSLIERYVCEDIKRGVQTLQYQVVTLSTTNGTNLAVIKGY